MFGLNIVKGLGVTLKHFVETYIDDLKYFPKSMVNEEAFAHRQGPDGGRGLFTVEDSGELPLHSFPGYGL